jgi:hypothetical protein
MKIFRTVSDKEFVWWKIYGFLWILIGIFSLLGNLNGYEFLYNRNAALLAFNIFFSVIIIILAIMTLRYNKYAFAFLLAIPGFLIILSILILIIGG